MITDAALALHDAGLCVLPAAADGTKMPGVRTWKQYQTTRPDRDQVRTWTQHAMGIGVLCGQVSGNLEMLEIEGAHVDRLADIETAATTDGCLDLLRRLEPDETSPVFRRIHVTPYLRFDALDVVAVLTKGPGGRP